MTTMTHQPIKPPPRILQLLEGRALGELAATLSAWPLLMGRAPRGDGHPVLVLPGLIADDGSTWLLRRFLSERGYDVHGWGLGRNYGPRAGIREGMIAKLDQLLAHRTRKVSIVGWSLGGAYARLLAAARPDAVRSVISLGSPITGDPQASNAYRLYRFTSGGHADEQDLARVRQQPVLPTTSIFSRGDGIVAWRASLQPASRLAESIEVHASHLGLGFNASVLYAVADRLAQPEGTFVPFDAPWSLKLLYPNPYRGSHTKMHSLI